MSGSEKLTRNPPITESEKVILGKGNKREKFCITNENRKSPLEYSPATYLEIRCIICIHFDQVIPIILLYGYLRA